jgi:hypothetical protein
LTNFRFTESRFFPGLIPGFSGFRASGSRARGQLNVFESVQKNKQNNKQKKQMSLSLKAAKMPSTDMALSNLVWVNPADEAKLKERSPSQYCKIRENIYTFK